MRKIESNIESIFRTLQHIIAQKDYLGTECYYTRAIFKRCFISIPCKTKMDAKTCKKNLSQLFDLAKEKNIQASFPHGIIVTYDHGNHISSEIFLEVLPCIQTFPKANVITSCMSPNTYKYDDVTLEFQIQT